MLGSLLFACAAVAAKPVAVMVHGAGGGGWEYRFWKPVFEKAGYKVIAKDLVPAKGGLEKTTVDDYVAQICRDGGDHPAVLIGASMGGVLVLKAAEKLHPKAIVLVCSTSPKEANPPAAEPQKYPAIVRWKGGPYKDTVDSMPDSDEAARKYAWPRWRDESGTVLNAISAGVSTKKPNCPVLCVIPGADDTIPPEKQQKLAEWCGADVMRFHGMSHVGTLMSRRGGEVASLVVAWLARRL
ncbi:MAG TPA: alpha/beta fold hydrolase [Fimbriimonadaceae bacterium]|nr:alpha/beta fold hydrolase [Fimbriimonadaceae bacterium]